MQTVGVTEGVIEGVTEETLEVDVTEGTPDVGVIVPGNVVGVPVRVLVGNCVFVGIKVVVAVAVFVGGAGVEVAQSNSVQTILIPAVTAPPVPMQAY